MPKRKVLDFKFEPLGTCPNALKKRWQKKANKAHTSFKAAIELKCLECTAWDRKEAITCFVVSCPLHAFNRAIFVGKKATVQEDQGSDHNLDSDDPPSHTPA